MLYVYTYVSEDGILDAVTSVCIRFSSNAMSIELCNNWQDPCDVMGAILRML